MESATLRILDKVVSVLLPVNASGKGMNQSSSQQRVISWAGWYLILERVAVYQKENYELKPTMLCLKIGLVSHAGYGGRVWGKKSVY